MRHIFLFHTSEKKWKKTNAKEKAEEKKKKLIPYTAWRSTLSYESVADGNKAG